MSAPKHTPGPWTFTPSRIYRPDCGHGITTHLGAEVTDSDNKAIIAACPNSAHTANWEANAALIARAPDLLVQRDRLRAACELALEKLDTTGEYPGIASELRSALA